MALTFCILEVSEVFPTVWASCLVFLVFSDAVTTEYFATFVGVISRMLVRVPGHTEADETLEVIRRGLQPVQVIATSIDCHVIASKLRGGMTFSIIIHVQLIMYTCI